MADSTKPWYLSKTIWANVIIGILGVVSEVSQVFPISQNPKVWVTVTALLNIVLRLVTTKPVAS